jgi:hypothetical protein
MNRWTRFYTYGVMGALGGLIGWQISNLLGLSFIPNLYMAETFVGALIGLSIGTFIGLAEGLVRRSVFQSLRSAGISGLLGMAGGAVGLPLAEGLFQLLGGETIGRVLGWAIFGTLTGLAAAWTGGTQMWKGALGGLIGGVLGSILLVASRTFLSDPMLGKAAGIILMGASVGVFIGLIVMLLAKAWIEVTSGKLKGMEFVLDKFQKPTGPGVFIGSDALKSELVLPDPDVMPQHAMLKGHGGHFTLKDMSLSGTFIDKKKVEVAQLKNQQAIRLGNTDLVYHEKR